MKKIFVAILSMMFITVSYAKNMENPLLGEWNGVFYDDMIKEQERANSGTIVMGNSDKGFQLTLNENELIFTRRGDSQVLEVMYFAQIGAQQPLINVVQKGDSDVIVFKLIDENTYYLYEAGDLQDGEDPKMVITK